MSSGFARRRLRTVDATTVPSAALVLRAAVKLPSTEYLPLAVELHFAGVEIVPAVEVVEVAGCVG